MPRYLAILPLLLLAGCSSPERPGSVEYLPPLINEIIEAPPEVVYIRLSEAFAKCFGNSGNFSVFENKRETHQEISVISEDLSRGYTELLKATVAPGTSGSSRVSYSWQNTFWERHVNRMQGWAHGKAPECE